MKCLDYDAFSYLIYIPCPLKQYKRINQASFSLGLCLKPINK